MVKQYGTTKRFGTRYGTTIKLRLGKVEEEQKKKQKCPYCGYSKVNRLALGIWQCGKCKAKFSSRAYSVMEGSRDDIKAKGI